jgi:hypothetical protein
LRQEVPEGLVTRLDVATPSTGDPFSFAVSPNGRALAFVANVEGESRLWIRPLDQSAAQPLAGTGGASYPFWSPDGQSLAFFADGKLKRIELTGSTVRELADAPSARGGTWSRDDVIVFAPRFNTGLVRVAASGGPSMPLTSLESGQSSHRWPQFLPDGRRFLFFSIAETQPDRRGVFTGSLDGGVPTRLLAANTPATYAPPGYLLRVSEGVLVAHEFDVASGLVRDKAVSVAEPVGVDSRSFQAAVSVSDGGVMAHRSGAGALRQLVWADRAGKTQNIVGASPDVWNATTVALAPDGARMAGTRQVQQNPDIWLLDVALGIGSRFTFDPALESYAGVVARCTPARVLVKSQRQARPLRPFGGRVRRRAAVARESWRQGRTGLVVGWALSVVCDTGSEDAHGPVGAANHERRARSPGLIEDRSGSAVARCADRVRGKPGPVFSGRQVGGLHVE